MSVRLRFESGPLAEESYELTEGRWLVGRDPSCDIVVDDRGVSGEHAVLTLDPDGTAWIEDRSTNGTFVDGRRIRGREPLPHGSEVRFASVVATAGARRGDTGEHAAVAAQPGSRALRGVLAVVAAVAVGAVAALLATGALGGGDDDGDDRASQRSATPTPSATPSPTPTATPTPEPLTRQDIVQMAGRSTLQVFNVGIASGSGWVFDAERGLIVTNAHVVEDGTEFLVARNGREPRAAALFSINVCEDLAVLQVEDRRGLRALELGTRPAVGEEVMVSGFPTNVVDPSTEELQRTFGSVARRKASATLENRRLRDLVQVNATTRPGDSGGPVMSLTDGTVVGVTTLGRTDDVETEGYAIAPGRAGKLLTYLVDGSSTPGMTLAFDPDQAAPPEVIGVTSAQLMRQGVEGPDEAGARQVLVGLRKADGTELAPMSQFDLCESIGVVGDGRGDRVVYTLESSDGERFDAKIEY